MSDEPTDSHIHTSTVRYRACRDEHPPEDPAEYHAWLVGPGWSDWYVYDDVDYEESTWEVAHQILDCRFNVDRDEDRPEGNYPHYLYIHSWAGLSRHEIVVRYSVHMSPGDEVWFGKNG